MKSFNLRLILIAFVLFMGQPGSAQLAPACSPTYSVTGASWYVSSFKIKDFTHTPTFSEHDFTAHSFSVYIDSVYDIAATTTGWCGIAVGADFNNDGDFDDVDEVMANPPYADGNPYTYNFSIKIPSWVPVGAYRFRFFNKGGNSTVGVPQWSPCGAYANGSWGDYTMIVERLVPVNAGISALTSPINFCTGSNAIKVKVKNAGSNVINTVNVGWSLNGVVQTPVVVSTPLAPVGTAGSELEIALGNYTFTSAPVAFKAWTYLPNGIADTLNHNDTLSVALKASLSGDYTVNSALATSGANYQSFQDLAKDLNNLGVCGKVTVTVAANSGPYTEAINFGEIKGASAAHNIRIIGNGVTVQFTNTTTNRQLLTLNGTQYLTIDNLKFKSLATDFGWAALLTNGARQDSIINCTFDLSSITGTATANVNGIVFSGSATSATTAGSNSKFNYIGNNHIKFSPALGGGYYGISLPASADSNVIEKNNIENHYFYGIHLNNSTGNQILGNEIHKTNKAGSITTFYGIYLTGDIPGSVISGNRIHHPGGLNGAASTASAIYSLANGTAAAPVLIANNAIYYMNQGGIAYGIFTSFASHTLIYHNTIVLDQPLTGTGNTIGIFADGTSTGSEVKNNNVSITGGSLGTKYGFYYSGENIRQAQKNNFYLNSEQPGEQYYGYITTGFSSQSAFRSAYPLMEIASPAVDPQFVNAATGNFNVNSAALFAVGENLNLLVPRDISGNTRLAVPTIGAFEQVPVGADNAGAVSFINPSGTFCAGAKALSVSIVNAGTGNISNLQLHWEINGAAQPVVNYTNTLVPASGGSGKYIDTVVLGNVTFPANTVTSVKVWTSLPNGRADAQNGNDTIRFNFRPSLLGTLTVNSAVATGGTNYQTFGDLTSDLNNYGVCGPVLINVEKGSGPYTETVNFGGIPGSSPVNTVRIKGNGAVVQYTNTATERQLLTLKGTKYLTIDSLKFQALATDYGWGALITGGSAYDSILNCTFDLSTVTSISSSNINGIAFSGSNTSPATAGINGSHCYVGKNSILCATGAGGAYYGISLVGTSDSNIIAQNNIENYYFYGIHVSGTNGNKILNNEVHKTNKTGSLTTFYGINTAGITPNLEIRGNRIHHPGGLNGFSGACYAINVAGDGLQTDPVLIANNAIYHLNMSGLIYGIYFNAAPYNLVYHNTIVIDQLLSGSSANHGIYATGASNGLSLKNNNVAITGGSSGIKYGFYYNAANSIADAQKNNFYVKSTQAGAQNYGYYTTAYATQAAFQAAYPLLEAGAPAADPMFVNPGMANFAVQEPALIAAGENLMSDVPNDILGNIRPARPTIGAFEQPAAGYNNAGAISFITPSPSFCAGQQSISLSINNAGINDITGLELHWTVNGVPQPVVNYTGTLVPGSGSSGKNVDTVILGNVSISNSSPSVIKAWVALPNGFADIINVNDTIQLSFQASRFVVSAVSDTICPSGNAVLSLKPNTGYAAGSLLWQSSLNNNTWSDISTATTVNYTESNLTAGKWYRVRIGTGGNYCYADSVRIVLANVTTPAVTAGERCGNGTVNLSAAGSSGAILNWYGQATGGTSLRTGSTYTTPGLTSTTTYYVSSTVAGNSYSCESARVPVIATVKANPVVNLGNDTALCAGASFVLNAGNPGAAYLWSNNSAAQTLNVSAAGTYYVQVTATNGCKGSDTLKVVAGITPKNNLPPTIDLCDEASVTLDAGNAGSSFKWNNAATTQTISVDKGGTYDVLITSSDFCTLTSSTVVTMRPLPIVNLGNDTAICDGKPITLDAENAGATYSWNTGATTQKVTASTANAYAVVVTTAYKCSATDTINIAILPAATVDAVTITDLSNEELGKRKFTVVNPQNVALYEWDFGDGQSSTDESPTHVYTSSALFKVVLKVSNACGSDELSQDVRIETVGITGTDESSRQLLLYPNPGKDEITIESKHPDVKIQEVVIVNVLGALVYETGVAQSQALKINVATLASGIYSARIRTDKGVLIKKFEVVR